MIILENAQWMDSASWNLTLAATQHLPGVLFFIALRPIAKSDSYAYSQLLKTKIYRMRLSNLNLEESMQLIASRLQTTKLPKEISEKIYVKSQGNFRGNFDFFKLKFQWNFLSIHSVLFRDGWFPNSFNMSISLFNLKIQLENRESIRD